MALNSSNALGNGTVTIAAGAELTLPGSQQGLLGRYYYGEFLDATKWANSTYVLGTWQGVMNGRIAAATQMSTVAGTNFDMTAANMPTAITGPLNPAGAGQSFDAWWTGTFNAPTSGSYVLSINCDDGGVIWLDGVYRTGTSGHKGQGTLNQSTVTLTLSAGPHQIDVGYDQGGGGYGVQLGVQTPGSGALVLMPNSMLTYGGIPSGYASLGGLAGAGTVTVSGITLNIGIANDSPTFAGTIQGTGTLVKMGTGTQTFTGTSTYAATKLSGLA